MKNVVFMMDIDIKGDGRYSSNRRLSYKYSIDSWKKWCEKNDCQLFIMNDLLLPNDEMGICLESIDQNIILLDSPHFCKKVYHYLVKPELLDTL